MIGKTFEITYNNSLAHATILDKYRGYDATFDNVVDYYLILIENKSVSIRCSKLQIVDVVE